MKYVLGVYVPGLLLGSMMLVLGTVIGLLPWIVLAWALISGLGIAVGFHRVYSHKTHDLSPWLDNLLLALGTIGGQGSSVSWVAVHRGYHHRHADTEKDLHSPTLGYAHALFGWYWNMKPDTINHKYAVELLRRPNHVFAHKHYVTLIWAWSGFLGVVYPKAMIVYWAALCLSLVQDNLVNTLCHTRSLGYRNYDTKDNSVNLLVLGYLGWGQGWHNNHHAEPASFNFGRTWWEFDPSRLWLPLLRLGSTKRKS